MKTKPEKTEEILNLENIYNVTIEPAFNENTLEWMDYWGAIDPEGNQIVFGQLMGNFICTNILTLSIWLERRKRNLVSKWN